RSSGQHWQRKISYGDGTLMQKLCLPMNARIPSCSNSISGTTTPTMSCKPMKSWSRKGSHNTGIPEWTRRTSEFDLSFIPYSPKQPSTSQKSHEGHKNPKHPEND